MISGRFAVAAGLSLCHQRAMVRRSRKSGGVFIFLGVLAGLVGGVIFGEPSFGVLIGTGAGVAAAAVIWLADRRR